LTDYRVFFVGADGHFEGSRTFLCDTDETAIAWARLEDRPLELWSGARLVKCLFPLAGLPAADSAVLFLP
jgi:hypothetical protein